VSAILFPFSIDGYGRVASTTDPMRIWADRVRIALMTNIGERVMRPRYGSEVAGQVFDLIDDAPEMVYAAIAQVFTDALPTLELLDVLLLSTDEMNGEVSLEVVYRVPDLVTDPVTQAIDLRVN